MNHSEVRRRHFTSTSTVYDADELQFASAPAVWTGVAISPSLPGDSRERER